jgi:hypothetical protein
MSYNTKQPLKVVFAPGAFDTFDGTQEELDALMAEINETFANMTPEELESQSHPVDEDELAEALQEVMQQMIGTDKRTLQ